MGSPVMVGILGIDVSKATLCTAFRSAGSRELVWQMQVDNSPRGIAQLLEKTPADAAWVLEPTGRYGHLTVDLARKAGRQVLMAPPRKASKFLQSIQDRAKTDELDGKGLSLYGLWAKLEPYPVKSEAVEQLDQLLSARKGVSRALSGLKQQQKELPYARTALQEAVKGLEKQLLELDKKIAAGVKSEPSFELAQRLKGVPGIGAVTSAAVTSRLVARKFDHSDQFVAYIGLDIGIRQSGTRKGNRGLTKQGDAELRRLLFVCARAAIRCKSQGEENPFRRQYQRELEKGLSTTAATCSVARKMARLCWSLWKHGTQYQPERVSQPAIQPHSQTDQAKDQAKDQAADQAQGKD